MKIEMILLSTLALVGCSPEIKSEDLIGRYIANTKGQESIVIRSDGTYTYAGPDSRGGVKRSEARWTYDGVVGDCHRVTFSDFQSPTGTGLWPACIEGTGKRLRLLVNEDSGWYYQKQ
jgi:hypothetical protein